MSGGSAVFDIAQQACVFMEVTPISSLDDASELAAALKRQYEPARDACLQAADWSFASRLVQLSQIDATNLPNDFVADDVLPYAYALPSDCLKIQEVMDGARWRIDADCLRANVPAPLRLRYTTKVANETRLPPDFRLAISYRLASMLAPRWTSTQSKVSDLLAMADQSLNRAKRSDGRSASPQRYDGGQDTGDWATVARL